MTEYIYNVYMNTNMNLIRILPLSSFLGLYLDENFNVIDIYFGPIEVLSCPLVLKAE